MGLRLGVSIALTVALTASAYAAHASEAGSVSPSAASRTLDRTFRCSPAAGELDIVVSPRGSPLQRGTVRATSSGFIGVGSGTESATSDLVIVRSRPQERFQQDTQAPGVYASRLRCVKSRAGLSLSARGLPRPPVRFEDAEGCSVRGRVLVRVRALLQLPTSWLPATAAYVGARRNVVEAKIALRSERTRRPIALLELGPAGRTRLWISPECG